MPTPTTDPHPVSAPDQGVPGDWLFEHAPLPQTCAVVTPDGALSQWRGNVAWHRLFEGAAPWVDPAVHAEFVHRLIARSGQGAEGVESLRREMALTDRQGRERQMLVKAHLLPVNGQTLLLAGYLDITKQRAAVMASIGEYREMVDSANDTILLVEHNRIIECNPAAEQLFGRSRAELIGQHPGDLSPPFQEGGIASMELAQQRMADALSEVRRRFLWRHLRPDGSEFTAEVMLNPAHSLLDDKGLPRQGRFVSIMRDATERLQAEQALKDSAERFQRLFELAPVPLALLEPRGRVLAVNRQWTQLLGYTLDEVPDIPTWVALAYPDLAYRNMALALWDQALTAVMEEGREMQPTEVQVRSKDGQMRSVLAVHVPIAGLSLLPLLFGLPLLFMPVHIAFLELIIDPVCSVVFEAEPEEADVMRRPPRRPGSPLLGRDLLLGSLVQGLLVMGLIGGFYVWLLSAGTVDAAARTAAFVALVGSNLALIVSNRSLDNRLLASLRRPNRALWVMLGVTTALLTLVLAWPVLRALFQFQPLTGGQAAQAAAVALGALALLEGRKALARRPQFGGGR